MAAAEVSNMNAGKEQQPASPASLRKRRRRVPTTGAAEDCHRCAKRGIKCDRRRPYCSQCLELGKDCSGYRTTLTWGVGVASRGKLRGMSLPIAKPASQGSTTMATPQTFGRPRANTVQTTPSRPDDEEHGRVKRVRLNSLQTSQPPSFLMQPQSEPFAFMPPGFTSPPSLNQWQQPPPPSPMTAFPGYQDGYNQGYATRRQDLFPLHTAVGESFTGLPWSPNNSVQSGPPTGFVENMSPFTNFPRAPAHVSFSEPFISPAHFGSSTNTSPQARNEDVFQPPPSAPVSTEAPFGTILRSSSFPHENQQRNHLEELVNSQMEKAERPPEPRPSVKRTRSAPVAVPPEKHNGEDTSLEHSQINSNSNAIIPLQPMPNSPVSNISSRMRLLLEFYDKNICPVLVTFDNEHNPYRKHIMHLALQNTGLQNALGALVTNNIRMRSLTEVPSLSGPNHKEMISKAIGSPTPEEQHYKAKSIDFLNTQLADPTKAMDNSVLATLLILCLFHVCDSGFSKFKTQLAGVQKLLKMRSGIPRTEFHGWVEMFFAWFDVMTSAVNDRETQIRGQVLDLMDLTNDLGSVEEFSGCDGRLFKLIARLGRLNLLSQQRSVRELPNNLSMAFQNTNVTPGLFDEDISVLPETLYFDENDPFYPVQESSTLECGVKQDGRHQFWLEWQDLHDRLHAWENSQFENTGPDPSAPSLGQRAMLHMSESFRWSALLYLERLAHPTLPSTSSNFQELVEKALHHIRDIGTNSCVTKFMLWPLFISGTECMNIEHRDLIRNRCIEIQKESGFYNNISGLEVLERVWKENDEERSMQASLGRPCAQQAFRWRNCMNRVDGEYIVI